MKSIPHLRPRGLPPNGDPHRAAASTPRRRLRPPVVLLCFVCVIWPVCLCVSVASCSSNTTTSKAKSADAEDEDVNNDQSEYFDITQDDTREHAAPDSCAEGRCVPCGNAVCLPGLFCEESKSACGWIPQCAEAFNCQCLEKELAHCNCEERSTGIYVDCG